MNACRKAAVEIRQQSKYNDNYNSGQYIDNYNYHTTSETAAISVSILSDGMAMIYGGEPSTTPQRVYDAYNTAGTIESFLNPSVLGVTSEFVQMIVSNTDYAKALRFLRGGDLVVNTTKEYAPDYTSNEYGKPVRAYSEIFFNKYNTMIAGTTTTVTYRYTARSPAYTNKSSQYFINPVLKDMIR